MLADGRPDSSRKRLLDRVALGPNNKRGTTPLQHTGEIYPSCLVWRGGMSPEAMGRRVTVVYLLSASASVHISERNLRARGPRIFRLESLKRSRWKRLEVKCVEPIMWMRAFILLRPKSISVNRLLELELVVLWFSLFWRRCKSIKLKCLSEIVLGSAYIRTRLCFLTCSFTLWLACIDDSDLKYYRVAKLDY
jgi:hypothetical protein